MANPTKARRLIALALALLVSYLPASAGVVVYRGTQGLMLTGTDGVYYDNTAGLMLTGTDGLLGLSVNGVGFTATGDGLMMTGTDGQTVTGADGATYTGANGYTATHVNGLMLTGTDGLMLTGTDGLMMTGTDGTVYEANSAVIRQANGLMLTGTDGVSMVGVNGLMMTGTDSLSFVRADGIMAEGAQSVRLDGAAQVLGVRADGTVFQAPTNGLVFSRVDGLMMTGTDGVQMYGVQGLMMTGTDGLLLRTAQGADQTAQGLVGIDPELALLVNKLKTQELLNQLTDDGNINAVLIYHRPVTDADLDVLRSLGIRGGTRFRALPMVVVSGDADQIIAASKLPSIRYLSKNRTLQWNAADESRAQTGLSRVWSDSELRRANNNLPVNGTGVAVAVIDTGVDSTHADLAGRVSKNVKLADLQGASPYGFAYPSNTETLRSTDLAGGHGTFVSGVIAGSGANSAGKYAGYAPGARIVALGAGDVSLFHVLAGFDYLLSRPDLGVRVVNCSFSANTLYHEDDPVNVATRMLTERGTNVVFSAGNSGPGMHTLNPYAAAPWVISVGAVDQKGRLADFSSRGYFGARNFRPTLVAGGVDVVSLRAAGTNLTGVNGLAGGADAVTLSPTELPYYTTASGTSFSAPQVAGTVALMLQANPGLSPAEVRDILQRTATPLPSYFAHEAGAGLLNTHAAVRESMFPQRRGGLYRSVLDREGVEFVLDPAQEISGTLTPGSHYDFNVRVPADAVLASASVSWGPMTSANDLGLQVFDPSNAKRAESNFLNLPGLTGKREGTTVRTPEPGVWRVRVHFTAGLAATPQEFKGVFQVVRARYGELTDLAGLDPVTLDSVRRAVRTFSMWPDAGGQFRPSHTLKRAELASAMLAGARVPQFMPAFPNFTDVADATTMSFVESAQGRPGGALFPDAARGGSFRPDEGVSRLLAAIVLVRAAGLEAETTLPTAGALPGVTDSGSIPYAWRGHVSVARAHGLVSAEPQFNPNAPFTRADLARALAVITHLQTKADDEQ